MGLQGNLKDMSVADIIQVNCQDKKTASATMVSNGREAVLYFKDGAVIHATLGSIKGEEVIYKVLSWDEGEFVLDVDVKSPEITIKRNWSGLLLEGAKRLDELNKGGGTESIFIEEVSGDRSEKINTILNQFINAFGCVELAAISGIDGYVKSVAYKEKTEESILGGVGAAAFNFGKRALGLLKMDQYMYSHIKGETHTIFVCALNKYTLLIVLSDNNSELKLDQTNKLVKALTPLI